MKATEIRCAAACKGSPVVVMECASLSIGDGDIMLVQSSIAERMVKQYRGKLVAGKEVEVERLSGGHYQLVQAKNKSEAQASARGSKAASKQAPASEGQVSDRSMGDQDGKPKSKKKTSKKK